MTDSNPTPSRSETAALLQALLEQDRQLRQGLERTLRDTETVAYDLFQWLQAVQQRLPLLLEREGGAGEHRSDDAEALLDEVLRCLQFHDIVRQKIQRLDSLLGGREACLERLLEQNAEAAGVARALREELSAYRREEARHSDYAAADTPSRVEFF